MKDENRRDDDKTRENKTVDQAKTEKQKTYQGQPVEIVRAAKKGDANFVEGTGGQVLIKLQDGNLKVVPSTEVVEA